jgi:hypothetical protein
MRPGRRGGGGRVANNRRGRLVAASAGTMAIAAAAVACGGSGHPTSSASRASATPTATTTTAPRAAPAAARNGSPGTTAQTRSLSVSVDPSSATNDDHIHLVLNLRSGSTQDDVIVWLDRADPTCKRSPGSVQNADASVVQYFNDASGSVQQLIGTRAGTWQGDEVVSAYISSGPATLCTAMYDDTTHARLGHVARARFRVTSA